ncbi:MAG: LCP family protein [Defluviitaleaceae bacterium]|nr:LCP family protein [Defluviitaleaceae bacterium]MCL2835259.1 LCP family protein [Defluviitaleaceae bacterium]
MSNNGNNGYRDNGPRPKPYIPPKATRPFKKSRKKRGPAFRFLVVTLSVFVPLILLTTAAIWVYGYMMSDSNLDDDQRESRQEAMRVLDLDDLITEENFWRDITSSIPQRTNFVIMGIDWEGQTSRSDVIMVGSFDTASNELSLISIPRDTHIRLSDSTRETIPGLNTRHLPGHSVRNGAPNIQREMKINAIWHFFGPVYGPAYVVNQIQELLDITIHYWVSVELDGFIKIIDAVGGVEYNVPQRMYYVFPKDEFGIEFSINLHPGLQMLNGKQALDMVRYRASSDESIARGYPAADLRRVQVQQNFMREVIPQVLNRDNIVRNIFSYIEIIHEHVETNLEITDALKYVNYARRLTPENIKTYTMPHMPNPGSYVYIDALKTYDLVQEIFYGNNNIPGEPEPETDADAEDVVNAEESDVTLDND